MISNARTAADGRMFQPEALDKMWSLVQGIYGWLTFELICGGNDEGGLVFNGDSDGLHEDQTFFRAGAVGFAGHGRRPLRSPGP